MNGTLTRFDAATLAQLNRALIGFDRIFDDMERRFANSPQPNYPPHNIIKYDDYNFEIEIAVAGFEREDITIEVDQDQLRVQGKKLKEEESSTYLYRGLAARDFDRSWTLADHIQVGDAELTNGILRIKLTRIVPEELKPRLIAIK
jgi:molecular chaperone IbpA